MDGVECRRGLTVGVMILFLSDCITVQRPMQFCNYMFFVLFVCLFLYTEKSFFVCFVFVVVVGCSRSGNDLGKCAHQ